MSIIDIIGSLDDKIDKNNEIVEKLKESILLETNMIISNSNKNIKLYTILEQKTVRLKTQVYPVMSVVSTGDIIFQDEQFTKNVASKETNNYKILKKYEFAYNPSRINIGSIGMLTKCDIAAVSPIYIVFKVASEYIFYFCELLKLDFMKQEIIKRCSGSVRQALPFEELQKIEIPNIEFEILKGYTKKYEEAYKCIQKLQQENNKLHQLKQLYLTKFFG